MVVVVGWGAGAINKLKEFALSLSLSTFIPKLKKKTDTHAEIRVFPLAVCLYSLKVNGRTVRAYKTGFSFVPLTKSDF